MHIQHVQSDREAEELPAADTTPRFNIQEAARVNTADCEAMRYEVSGAMRYEINCGQHQAVPCFSRRRSVGTDSGMRFGISTRSRTVMQH